MKRGRPRKDGLTGMLPGPKFVRECIQTLPRPGAANRDRDFIERYRSGQTLAQIGAHYGITRERVRQRLAKHGIRANGGGASARAVFRAHTEHELRRAKDETRTHQVFGVSLDAFRAITGLDTIRGIWALKKRGDNSVVRAYLSQKINAKKRGIGWKFDLASWWKVWQDSGHWESRGRGKGYCMARWADEGPYSPENVYICTIGQNFSDSWLVRPRKAQQEAACSI